MVNSMFIYLIFALFSVNSYAQFSGLQDEIDRFVNQVNESNQRVKDAMSEFVVDYTNNVEVGDKQFEVYQSTYTDVALSQSPIHTIRYGYVDDYSNFFVAAGADNVGMYVLEVTFKNGEQYKGIHPSLSGKTVLLIAHGPGPTPTTIYTTGNTAGSSNLQDYNSMYSIGGFSCRLKANRCTSVSGSTNRPLNTCGNTEAVNDGKAPGMIVGTSQSSTFNLNLFYYIAEGPFTYCADANALKDSMG